MKKDRKNFENIIENNLKIIKEKNPLTHCITNSVTINDCANAILAIGGSPFMAEDAEELAEVVAIADALVINIGKLSENQIKSMKISSKTANETNTPIILDPVGVGVTELRNKTTLHLINNYNISVIRGNISEIKAIAKLVGVLKENNAAKGVDVNIDDIITEDNLCSGDAGSAATDAAGTVARGRECRCYLQHVLHRQAVHDGLQVRWRVELYHRRNWAVQL